MGAHVGAKARPGGAQHREFSMSRHLRFYFASFVLFGALSTAPASSNPLADFFNTATPQPAVTSPPQAECLPRPGTSIPDGQHWVYRKDGHRKCWFLAEGIATVKKQVNRRVAKDHAIGPDENDAARQKRGALIDARAELLRSAPADSYHRVPSAHEVNVADAASDLAAGTIPPRSVLPVAGLPSGQLTPEQPVPRQVDVEQLLAAAPADSSPAIPMGARNEEARDEAHSRKLTWLGVLLMTLGGFSILSSSRTVRHAVRLRR